MLHYLYNKRTIPDSEEWRFGTRRPFAQALRHRLAGSSGLASLYLSTAEPPRLLLNLLHRLQPFHPRDSAYNPLPRANNSFRNTHQRSLHKLLSVLDTDFCFHRWHGKLHRWHESGYTSPLPCWQKRLRLLNLRVVPSAASYNWEPQHKHQRSTRSR